MISLFCLCRGIGLGGFLNFTMGTNLVRMPNTLGGCCSYDVLEFLPVASDKSHARIIWDCAWAAEGDLFATASRDKTVSSRMISMALMTFSVL